MVLFEKIIIKGGTNNKKIQPIFNLGLALFFNYLKTKIKNLKQQKPKHKPIKNNFNYGKKLVPWF